MNGLFDGINVNLGGFEAKFIFSALNNNYSSPTSDNLHIHYQSEIHFIISGSFELVTEAENYSLSENDVCIVPRNTNHKLIASGRDCKTFSAILSLKPLNVKTREKQQLRQKIQVWNTLKDVRIFKNSTRLCQYIKDFIKVCDKQGAEREYLRKSIMITVFFGITDKLEQLVPCPSIVAKACSITYRGIYFDAELENFLMNNYSRKLTREQVAKTIGISTAQLSRIIKRNYAMSYAKLITSLRMNKAMRLMSGDKSLSEIAKMLGYSTYNGFAYAFKTHYGSTPETIRTKLKTKEQ